VRRPDPLAAHARWLGNQELNELLVQLPKPAFAALVEVALARPVLPAGLVLRYEPAPGSMAGRWWPARPAGGWAPSPATATQAVRWRGGP
jgi:hypothetical protein